MPQPRQLPPDLPSSFTYLQGITAGASARRLRNRDIDTPFRGGRAQFPTVDTVALAHAYAPLLLPGQHFSHLTAAQLQGLRMPEGFRSQSLHVTSLAPRRAPRRPLVIGHQSQNPEGVDVVNRVPTSGPVRAWFECAEYLSVDDLIVMGDTLIRRRAPIVSLVDLITAAESRRRDRGIAKIARALPQMRERTDSARETMLRLLLERAGFPEPEVNGEIRNGFGVVIAHGDLVYRDFGTIVEYDGGQHRTDELQFDIDIERLDELMEERWRVIRVGKKLMRQRAMLLGKVTVALESGGWRSSPR